MDATDDARRIAAGPSPGQLVGGRLDDGSAGPSAPQGPGPAAPRGEPPFDPLRLCIIATVALLGWLAGPVALVVFAGLGFAGYRKARRRGLKRSQCFLRDTRLVLAYLAVLLAAALYGTYLVAGRLLGV